MSKKQEVVKKEEFAVGPAANLAEWGDHSVSLKDFVIPKIRAMQPMSEMVTQGDAKIGDFRVTGSPKHYGSIDQGLEFIPFKLEKVWHIFKSVNNDMKFSHVEPVTVENENLPWEYDVGGVKHRRDYTMNFYVLLAEDLKAGEATLPHVLSFKRTSIKAGKQLYTQMYIQNRTVGLPPAAFVMKLGGKKVTNNKGTFISLTVSPVRKASSDELNSALQWFKTFGNATVVVDNSDLAEETVSASTFDNDEF